MGYLAVILSVAAAGLTRRKLRLALGELQRVDRLDSARRAQRGGDAPALLPGAASARRHGLQRSATKLKCPPALVDTVRASAGLPDHRAGWPAAVHIQLPPVQPDPHCLDPQSPRELRVSEPDRPTEAWRTPWRYPRGLSSSSPRTAWRRPCMPRRGGSVFGRTEPGPTAQRSSIRNSR
jgi:hypothetical protein